MTYKGTSFDQWWPRDIAGLKESVPTEQTKHCNSAKMTVMAVNAPNLKGHRDYTKQDLEHLVAKIFFIYEVARREQMNSIMIGLLGGGAFRGNRPL